MNTPHIECRRFALPAACHFPEPQKKDLIVLCATGSVTAESAVTAWRRKSNLHAVPYVVDPDGTVFETFDPRGWAFHLKMPAQMNPAARNDRRSIAISLVNPGGLKQRADGKLAWWLDGFTKVWCDPDDSSRCMKATFRGFNYFAKYTDAQFKALQSLVPWLCREHGIPWQLPAPSERLAADPRRFARFRGILAHHHFRPEHADIGPAFDWDRISPPQEA